MTDEQFQQLIQVLGEVGSTAYASAIKGVYVEGATSILLFVILAGVGAACLASVWRMVKSADGDWYEIDPVIIFPSIGMVLLFVFSVVSLCTGINYLLAPDWYALQRLAGLVIK